MTDEEFQVLESLAVGHSESLVRKKCTAILLLAEGVQQIDVAEELGVTRQTIYRWHKNYETVGIENFCAIKVRGRPPILTPEKAEKIKETLLETQKTQSPLVGHEMKDLLMKEGYTLSLATVYNILHKLKLSHQVPRPIHPKRNENHVKEWLSDLPNVLKTVAQAKPKKN